MNCTFQVTRILTPVNQEISALVNQINTLKEELSQISQVDEFAKYSKTERKILKLRQELDSKNKSSSTSTIQAKAAFNTVWLTIAVRKINYQSKRISIKNLFFSDLNIYFHYVELRFNASTRF